MTKEDFQNYILKLQKYLGRLKWIRAKGYTVKDTSFWGRSNWRIIYENYDINCEITEEYNRTPIIVKKGGEHSK